jgi:uncharacterized protein (DUF427 family)
MRASTKITDKTVCNLRANCESYELRKKMPKATWEGAVLAESDDTVVIEGNHYFPAESLNRSLLRPSSHTTVCSWKGTASYYDVVVDGKTNCKAAWYYPHPKPAAAEIKDRVAFWKGVKIRE